MEVERPDILCGGFPCQDLSIAGKGAGIILGERSGLWKYYNKAIRLLLPKYAVVENVSGLIGWFDLETPPPPSEEEIRLGKREVEVEQYQGIAPVLSDIAEAGYDAEWHNISAASVGAWHKRERIFIIAYPSSSGKISEEQPRQRNGIEPLCADVPNTNSKRELQQKGSLENIRGRISDSCEEIPDSSCLRHGKDAERGIGESRETKSPIFIQKGTETTKVPNTKSILLEGLVQRQRQRQLGRSGWWEVEPRLGRVAHGVPNRVDRIKCLGNAVVPQVAQVVGEMILDLEAKP